MVEQLCTLVSGYLGELSSHAKPVSVETAWNILRLLSGQHGQLSAGRLRRAQVLALFPQSWVPNTRGKALEIFHRFFAWCVATGAMKADPIANVKRPPRVYQDPLLPEDEAAAARICSSIQHDTARRACLFALYSGLRIGTILQLRADWCQTQAGKAVVAVPGAAMKTGRDFWVPLRPEAWEAVQGKPGASAGLLVFPIPKSTLEYHWGVARRKAGYPALNFHCLRKCFLTYARMRGVPLEVACRLSGHTSFGLALRIYRQVQPQELMQACKTT